MALTQKHYSVIHVAKAQLGLSDADYRAILLSIAGVESCTQLSDAGFEAVMFRFQELGFVSTWNRANFGYRPGMATPRQVAMIRELWADFTDGQGTDATLGKWLESKFHVSSLRFLPADTARKAIGALKAMTAKREGLRKRG